MREEMGFRVNGLEGNYSVIVFKSLILLRYNIFDSSIKKSFSFIPKNNGIGPEAYLEPNWISMMKFFCENI